MPTFIDFTTQSLWEEFGVTRSGTLHFQFASTDWDQSVFDFLSRSTPTRRFDIKFTVDTERQPIPCPSFWRHPLSWLRWNPLLTHGAFTSEIALKDIDLDVDD